MNVLFVRAISPGRMQSASIDQSSWSFYSSVINPEALHHVSWLPAVLERMTRFAIHPVPHQIKSLPIFNLKRRVRSANHHVDVARLVWLNLVGCGWAPVGYTAFSSVHSPSPANFRFIRARGPTKTPGDRCEGGCGLRKLVMLAFDLHVQQRLVKIAISP